MTITGTGNGSETNEYGVEINSTLPGHEVGPNSGTVSTSGNGPISIKGTASLLGTSGNTGVYVTGNITTQNGALGITDATPLAFWWRHERGARIYDGADEVHKTSAAKRILERYGMERTKG